MNAKPQASALLNQARSPSLTTTSELSPRVSFTHEPVVQHGVPTILQVCVAGGASRHQLSLWFSRHYMEAVEIDCMEPQVQGVHVSRDRVGYVFAAVPHEAIVIRMTVRLARLGVVIGEIALDDEQPSRFAQRIEP